MRERPLFPSESPVLGFDDVLILPDGSLVQSRHDVSLDVELPLGFRLRLPLLSAPMDTIASPAMGAALLGAGAGFCIPKTLPTDLSVEWTTRYLDDGHHDPKAGGLLVVAVGPEREENDLEDLLGSGVDALLVELPQVRMSGLEGWLRTVSEVCADFGCLMLAGNVCTERDVLWLREAVGDGLHAVKAGHGFGGPATTRWTSGLGYPTLQSVLDLAHLPDAYPVLADGGIRYPGDAAKALAAGAIACVCGTLLAGTDEAGGREVARSNKRLKEFRGMSSRAARAARGDEDGAHAQGSSGWVPWRGPVDGHLGRLRDGLRGAVAGAGCSTLEEFRRRAQFVRLSHGVAGLVQEVREV
jgi:IMP dehydrogenase